ncbi:hypothetical protein [Brunnivagina elsteri]|uniref:Uncharacterized protein n=1 Tax=Brunnivagina elsteri CCALA 953 TaxID=987040 RepID=A0A2A2TM10_9CYAN|nr:hypothetical protein [Calothrix elsteri]PAX59432.1 hypothetical protein CK510_07010 [Calothrix elsteri CCALA 953]
MYNNIEDIDREIAALKEQRNNEILYWFEMGESDRSAFLPPQYAENPWYKLGYDDRKYQLEIGFNPTPVNFNPF